MTVHKMHLSKEPFDKIASGDKIIESRLFDKKRQSINIGDKIEFSENDNPERRAIADVTALYRYGSFHDLVSDFPPEYFGEKSSELLLQKISHFYSEKEQSDYGVIGIKIKLQK